MLRAVVRRGVAVAAGLRMPVKVVCQCSQAGLVSIKAGGRHVAGSGGSGRY